MTAKQSTGSTAPDGSQYAVLTNGSNTLSAGGSKQSQGSTAPDESTYITSTDGNGTLA